MTNQEIPIKKTRYTIYKPDEPLLLESGEIISAPEIAFHTYGELNTDHSNVIWACHALTANSDPFEWWPGLFGSGKLFDPEHFFIVCANVIGSCYGSTGPLSFDPELGRSWYRDFPVITIRDMVNAHEMLRKHLRIERIHTLIGGSLGGFQALEWSITNPDIFQFIILIGCNEKTKPWTIAFNESQRMAIRSDPSFFHDIPEGGFTGLQSARAIALLSYRTPDIYNIKHCDDPVYPPFKAATYQQYQGLKLARRFNAYSYMTLTDAMDLHNVFRNRSSDIHPLSAIIARTLCIGIHGDLLFPTSEVQVMAGWIRGSTYRELITQYGHDGFLIETDQIRNIIKGFYHLKQSNHE
ncbi:MAG: homoserine O-acetyltransferase [Bacteroidales bacterium]|nr:homoserine O-acetyltransferase [Bacteroidales bacterium]